MSFSAKNDDGPGFGLKDANIVPLDLTHLREAGVMGTSQSGIGVFGTSGDVTSLGLIASAT
jgi:hypothetical protein